MLLRNYDLTIQSESETAPTEPPPPYFERRRPPEKRAVEVCEPPANAEFEPVERQRHFGILRYTVNNRFNKLMCIGILNVLLLISILAIIVLVVLLVLHSEQHSKVLKATITTTRTRFVVVRTTPRMEMTSKKVSTSHTSQKTTRKLTTTTTSRSSTITTAAHPGLCTPLDHTTLLFAYSNDFDQFFVNTVINNYLKNNISPHYTTFASIRFDTKTQGDFGYFTNFGDIALYSQNHPPQPSLGFASSDSGSDVLKMIGRFLDNTRVPVCGSRMIIYAKRYPNETDYSQVMTKLRQHHAYLSIFASTNPSGGYHPETLYDLASKTNGMCGFDADLDMTKPVDQTVSNPYLVYAANPMISGTGRVMLPVLSVLKNMDYWFSMTIENNGPTTSVQTALLTWKNNNDNGQMGISGSNIYGAQYGNIISNQYSLNNIPYGMQLQYGYSDSKQKKLQIRIYMKQDNLIDYWLPYDN